MKKCSECKNKWLYMFIASFSLCMLAICIMMIALSVICGSLKGAIAYLAQSAFSDFGQMIYFTVADNPYTAEFHTMYTPINFLFYLPFKLVCGSNELFYALKADNLSEYNTAILQTWEFWVCLVIYYVVTFTLLFLVLKKTIPAQKLTDKIAFFFAVGFSIIIGFGFIRASNVFIVLTLFIAYVNWHDSDIWWKRELSLIFFAIAGTMKFYVLFSGVLLLKERRWLDVAKCIIYFFICFFVPFFFYEMPADTIMVYLRNLFSFAGEEGRIGGTTNISIYNIVYWFFSLFGVQDNIAVTVLCWAMMLAVFVTGIITCLKTNSRFSQLIAMCAVFALVTPVSYLYLLSFFILPLAVFLGEAHTFTKARRTFYYIAFFILAFIPVILLQFFLIYGIVILTMLIVEMVTSFKGKEKTQESLLT